MAESTATPPDTEPLSVLVDALAIPPFAGGTRVYLQQLLRRLQQRVRLHVVCTKKNAEAFEDLEAAHLTVVPLAHRSRVWRVAVQQLLLPLIIRRYNPSLVFAPVDVAPLLSTSSIVTCLHSSHINMHFGYVRGLQARYLNLFIRLSIRRSTRVIASSEYVRQMTAQLLGVNPGDIGVVHLGGGLLDARNDDRSDHIDDSSRTGGILFLSTLNAHKGLEQLIEVYAELRKRLPDPPRLVIVGKDPGGQESRMRAVAKQHGVSESVDFLGRISNAEVVRLLEESQVLVYPSKSEGFGMPVLEAMAAKLPVVAANRASLPEIVGDAGVLVDPDDKYAMADAVYRVLTDRRLRERLIAAGLERARQFSWDRTADETLRVWQAAAEGSPK